jgi:FAD/FMN-containing dehydrogenase
MPDTIEGFEGSQFAPGDDGYDDARRVYNALIDRRPGLIVRPTGAQDVAAAVAAAREQGLEISVKGGGHSVAGRALTDGGLMIDLSGLKRIDVDPDSRTARADPGVIWAELNEATQAYGLAVTGGVISTTGIAGLTLGGGLGWLMPKFGLALDNLLSAEVVTADGRVLTASADENPDLFWALRGGGGNFGVVTSFTYRLHEVGPTVTGGLVIHPLPAARDLLHLYREWTAGIPDELMAVGALVDAPDGSGAKLAGVAVCHIGTPEQAERDLAPLLGFGTPVLSQIGPIPYAALNGMLDAGYPYGSLNYWKSDFLPELSDGAIDMLIEEYADRPAPLGGVVIEHFHGEVTRVPVEATACEMRNAGYQVALTTTWTDPGQTDAAVAWTRDVHDRLQPFASGFRYVNYLADDDDTDEDMVTHVYAANAARLADVKRAYDPDNVFHVNMNVVPA